MNLNDAVDAPEAPDTPVFDRLAEEARLARIEARLLEAAAKVQQMRTT